MLLRLTKQSAAALNLFWGKSVLACGNTVAGIVSRYCYGIWGAAADVAAVANSYRNRHIRNPARVNASSLFFDSDNGRQIATPAGVDKLEILLEPTHPPYFPTPAKVERVFQFATSCEDLFCFAQPETRNSPRRHFYKIRDHCPTCGPKMKTSGSPPSPCSWW